MHLAASQREGERVQAVKSGSQAASLIKYLEQREVTLLHSLQEARKQHGKVVFFDCFLVARRAFFFLSSCLFFFFTFQKVCVIAWSLFFPLATHLDEKFKEMSAIIDEQRSIIQTLKDEYAALVEDFQKWLVASDS